MHAPTQASMETTADQVHRTLREAILRGDLPPGVWLRQRTIARCLGVSATPVVEAFRQLETAGLLERVPRWGVRVAVLTVDQFEQLKLMRGALEGVVFRRLAERIDMHRGALEALRPLAHDIDRILQYPAEVDSRREVVLLDIEFHRKLGELAALDLLVNEFSRLALIERTMATARAEVDRAGPLESQPVTHVELIDAILTGDSDRAEWAARRAAGPSAAVMEHLRSIYGDGPIISNDNIDDFDISKALSATRVAFIPDPYDT